MFIKDYVRMPVRPPRRIFRRPLAARVIRIAGPLGLGGALAAGAWFAPWPQTAPAPRPAAAETLTASAGDVTVLDGTTLRLHGRVVRLSGISAPARDACPAAGPARDCGAAAAAALATLVRAARVDCVPGDPDAMGRPVARCEAGGHDLSRALVAGGWAHVVDRAPDLAHLETQARVARRGYWASADGRSW